MNDLTNFNNIFKTQTLSQIPFHSYQKYYWKKGTNVKIQKVGYYFCGQRISCYISNLI